MYISDTKMNKILQAQYFILIIYFSVDKTRYCLDIVTKWTIMTVQKSLFQLVFVLSLAGLLQGQAEGGKAHFQVHNKIQGNMVIKATKAKASVCIKC